MKILIVITKGDVGGAQTVVFNMAKELGLDMEEVAMWMNNYFRF